ncbi:MAG: FecR domain-containing protein, partial [Verrucomicrobiota bacterium]
MTPYNDSLENDAEGEAIQLAAAEWLVRQDQPLTAVEEREFECWLAADPRHAQAHALLQETWHLLDRVPAHRVPLQRRAARPWWWVVGSVAAAAAALAVVFFQGTERHSALPPTQRAATSVGGFESLALADGSVVRLNTASEVSVDFSGPERRVTLLRGEASFEVAKDPARPFIVRVGEIDVRAVGTVFNIRHDARAIEVLVTEGKVRLDEVVSGRSLATAVAIAATTPEAAVAESAAADAVSAARTAGISAATQLLTAGQRATILRPSLRSATSCSSRL